MLRSNSTISTTPPHLTTERLLWIEDRKNARAGGYRYLQSNSIFSTQEDSSTYELTVMVIAHKELFKLQTDQISV